jgi:hypothetical protein
MRTLLHRATTNTALLLGLLLASNHAASAQAVVTAQRGAELAPFAMTTLVSPDYGQPHNIGYIVGADYTRLLRSIVQPAIEFRYTHANGSQVDESSYGGGLKLQTTIHGIQPYATVLIGQGNLTLVNTIASRIDNSTVFSIGGGADFNITRQWRLRADFTDQHWSLDPGSLTPMTFAVGIAYTVPFHGRTTH